MTDPNPILRFENVTAHYPNSKMPVLHDLSFALRPQERVALLGLNGSGKSSVLLSCVGLLRHKGEISVAGIPVSPKTIRRVREQIGFLFTLPEDQLIFTRVLDDVALALRQRGVKKEDARFVAVDILGKLGAADLAGRSPYELSHGQRQRVALAGALVADPPLLLLDEPSAGLDPVGKRQLSALLSANNAGMLIATHDLDFAQSVCSRYIVLAEGKKCLETDSLVEVRDYWGITDR